VAGSCQRLWWSPCLALCLRKSKDLETQIEQLTAELAHLQGEIAERMGDRHEY